MRAILHLLRPCLRSRCRPLSVLLPFHNATGIQQRRHIQQRRQNHVVSIENGIYQELSELNGSSKEAYPRILASESGISCLDFVNKYEDIKRGETIDSKCITIRGMFVWLKPPDLGLCL